MLLDRRRASTVRLCMEPATVYALASALDLVNSVTDDVVYMELLITGRKVRFLGRPRGIRSQVFPSLCRADQTTGHQQLHRDPESAVMVIRKGRGEGCQSVPFVHAAKLARQIGAGKPSWKCTQAVSVASSRAKNRR